MEDFWAGYEAHGSERRSSITTGDTAEIVHADDPLGDEAAFPMTWQHLAPNDAQRD